MQRDNKQQCSTTATKAGRQQGKVRAIFMRQQTQTAGNGRSMAAMQQASNIHARLQQGASNKATASRSAQQYSCREAEKQRQHVAVAKRER
jgi:hypothetical protein